MKKLLSLLLAMTMAMALAVPAAAAERDDVIGGADDESGILLISEDGELDAAQLEQMLKELEKQAREENIQALGGTLGRINVLLNDRCVSFSDAKPEIKNGRTMVPMRAAVEAMGASVEYDRATRTASVQNGTLRFTHVIGTDTITMGNGEQIKMDVASYIDSGRTMVPVRFFSQVLGYDVFWDGDYRMVFLMDKDTFVQNVDSSFGILNEYLAKSARNLDPSKSYKEEASISGEVKVVDSIKGNRSYPYSGKLTALVGKDGMTMSMNADLSGLVNLLEGIAGDSLPAEYRAQIAKLELEAIFGDQLYLKSPLFDALVKAATGTAPAAGTWYAMDMGTDFDVAALYQNLFGSQGDYTVGGILYATMLSGEANRFYDSWEAATTAADLMKALMSDETFTKSGGSYQWHFGMKELAKLLDGTFTEAELKEAGIEELSIDMTIRANGNVDLKCAMTLNADDEALIRLDYTMSGSSTRVTFDGTVQVRNLCDVTFKGNVTVNTTNEKIVTKPGSGASVVDLDGLAA